MGYDDLEDTILKSTLEMLQNSCPSARYSHYIESQNLFFIETILFDNQAGNGLFSGLKV